MFGQATWQGIALGRNQPNTEPSNYETSRDTVSADARAAIPHRGLSEFYELIVERHRHTSTTITSNREPQHWPADDDYRTAWPGTA
jgi:hypothetical protein